MELLRPALAVLNRFYMPPPGEINPNLKLILSRELDRYRAASPNVEPGQPGGDIHAAVTRTVYGVIRKDQLLGYVIQKTSGRKLKKIQDHVQVILKTGAYLLLFSAHPDHAVVNEVVASVSGKARSFVNAVLRNIAREKTVLLHEVEHLPQWETVYSMPPFLIDQLKQISPQPREHLEYLNRDPLFHIRVNTLKYTYEDVRGELTRQDISFTELPLFSSFQVKESGRVIRQLLKQRMVYFQNTGSQLISILAANERPRRVLDCCAAPGTKSVTLSMLASQQNQSPPVSIVANDIHPGRTALMKSFLHDFDIPNVIPISSDIVSMPFLSHDEPGRLPFDLLIADAPCTSSGTLRKNPDLKLKIDQNAVNTNRQKQLDILGQITGRASRSPVTVIYSVCSFIRGETEDVLEEIFQHSPHARAFQCAQIEDTLETYGFDYAAGKYGYYLLPSDRLNNDMFYISLFRG